MHNSIINKHATYHHSGTNMKSRGIIVYHPILRYILSANAFYFPWQWRRLSTFSSCNYFSFPHLVLLIPRYFITSILPTSFFFSKDLTTSSYFFLPSFLFRFLFLVSVWRNHPLPAVRLVSWWSPYSVRPRHEQLRSHSTDHRATGVQGHSGFCRPS